MVANRSYSTDISIYNTSIGIYIVYMKGNNVSMLLGMEHGHNTHRHTWPACPGSPYPLGIDYVFIELAYCHR